MKPTPEQVLNQSFVKLAMELGPALPPSYEQGSLTLIGLLLLMTAQEFNRAADVRVKENRAMRSIFVEAGRRANKEFADRLAAAAKGGDDDLTIAALDQRNADLKRLLIELHVDAEHAGDKSLELKILRFLQEAAAARQIQLPAM